MITKEELDKLVLKYETEDFIKNDPIQFPHRFESPTDIEIAGFIASLFAYGNRKAFCEKLDALFNFMEGEPQNFVENFEPKILKGFNYRFAKDYDIIEIFRIMRNLYLADGGFARLFDYGFERDNPLENVVQYFYLHVDNPVGQGFYHMIPNPTNGGAMKRMWMYLRWMVRRNSCVDFGLWDFIEPCELKIPLDTHVAKLSREMGLLERASNDCIAVDMLTEKLQQFDPQDPIKYDFAIFGLGVDK